MAFEDFPIVDLSSIRSEESVLKTMLLFSRKNGFISREEKPDYGVDLTVEIADGHNASGNIFHVQIKSTDRVKTRNFEGNEYLTYVFPTSRLGYLCRRQPGMGLIVLYEGDTDCFYYDYVEEVVNRITLFKDSENWKNQEEVTIYIPLSNLLLHTELANIFFKMKNRFVNHISLINEFGEEFGIENILKDEDTGVPDLRNPAKLSKWVDINGISLLGTQKFGLLSHIMTHLRYSDIIKSEKSIFVAAISHLESGLFIEADLYLKKCKQRLAKYDEEVVEYINFADLKVDASLGRLPLDLLQKKLHELSNSIENNYLKLNISSWNLRNKILLMYNQNNFSDSISQELNNLLNKVLKSKIEDELKNSYLVQIYETYLGYFLHLLSETKLKASIIEKAGPLDLRFNKLEAYKFLMGMLRTLMSGIQKVIEFSINNDEILLANSNILMAKYNWAIGYNTHIVPPVTLPQDKEQDLFNNLLSKVIGSAHILEKNGYKLDAYKAIGLGYEIVVFYEYVFKAKLEKDVAYFLKYLKEFEEILDIEKPFQSITEDLIKKISGIEQSSVDQLLANLNEADIKEMAETLATSLSLPQNRLDNIIGSIKAQVLFQKTNKNEHFELHEDLRHTYSHETYYAEPVSFVLYDVINDCYSKPYTVIEDLIDTFKDKLLDS